jgi:hypothetical protein
MVDYSKAKIYKILNDLDDDVYIGSTCQTLSQRMAGHRRCFKHKTNKLHTKMREIGIEHFFIRLVQELPECQNVEQLRKKEGEIIIELQPALNVCVAGRTKTEWYADNADKLTKKRHEDYINNREHILEKNKQYRNENYEKVMRNKAQYYFDKREQINNRRRERIQCPYCQKELSRAFLTTHLQKQHY